ncbi:type 1 glutamine amidotransferase domain-containing protein [Paenibacillus sp. HN-1]|uniref:type 1 glutamine amidotransferase domain-containing protein n=1 Tax=Paenibacillus TaxID=44249 RepID=UPI001CA8BB49|nr:MULTISPECIES: type 1 glutamine amidotransferase domain-containing protein [Paenibacillus]MBY9080553.1 type 1 glutamine amidotransferase domain-containing protein [Paenibacillus sp. CGMCC 1.18879]MBY9085502.1 type 1 glutamine amidotransferase domain-containing protein [Paenibacillus sinensis]
MAKKVLMVVTNHSEINKDRQTGIWLSEFAEAYIEFTKKGYEVTVASPLGGKSPVDPGSVDENTAQELLDARRYLEQTLKLDEVSYEKFDAIFLPGGHGTMYDLPASVKLQELLKDFYEAGKIVAAVCHGPAGLVGATLSNGQPLVAGKRVSAFTDREEAETGLNSLLPFLLESKIRELGAIYVAAPNWSSHYETDGNLITGQNPQSTLAVAQAVIEKLG